MRDTHRAQPATSTSSVRRETELEAEAAAGVLRPPRIPQYVVGGPKIVEQVERKAVEGVAAHGGGVRAVGARALVGIPLPRARDLAGRDERGVQAAHS